MELRSSNKQIVKNAVFLYMRMAIIMLVQLYTSRVVLMALGVTDYGLYNVVGGIVVMFGFISGALTGSTQRYITYELGCGSEESLQNVFSSSLLLHFIIATLIVVVSEPVGLWLIFNKMQVPEGRLAECIWVFQFSIASFVINVISVPYNACIIAHERMTIFAYISIVDALMKLLIVFAILIVDGQRLVLYAFLGFAVQGLIRIYYGYYCNKHFKETIYRHNLDKPLLKEMLSFSGWNLFGNVAVALNTQGVNILLNVFFGPVANAARGLAVSVQTAVRQFSNNFLTAVDPELTKSYAAGEYNKTFLLMFRASRFSFYLLYMVTLPLLIETKFVLSVWLKEVPPDTATFIRILLLMQLMFTMTVPMTTVTYASGHIKKVNAVCGFIVLFALPISWVILKLGGEVWTPFVVVFAAEFISFVARTVILRSIIHFSIRSFVIQVMVRALLVALVSTSTVLLLRINLPSTQWSSILVIVASAVSVVATAYTIGMSKNERKFMFNMVTSRFKK